MSILVSSCENCDLNVSNNSLSNFLTLPRRVCKEGVNVSGLNVFIYHLLCGETVERSLWYIVNACFYVTYTLYFVECEMFISIVG